MLRVKNLNPVLWLMAFMAIGLAPSCGGPTGESVGPAAAERPAEEVAVEEAVVEEVAAEQEAPVEEVVVAEPIHITEIVADGMYHKEGLLPVIFAALTDPDGEDIYPLGDDSFTIFGLYDTGSSKVRINDLDPPNRVSGGNWDKSDTGHLNLTSVEKVNLRLNGLNARQPDDSIPMDAPGSTHEAQVEVRSIYVKPEDVDVSLIGAPVVNQVIAYIDYTDLILDPAIDYAGTKVEAPFIELFLPDEPGMPEADMTLALEPFGDLLDTDGATLGQRYWLQEATLMEGDREVSGQQDEFNFLFDTGTTLTIINDKVADSLSLVPEDADFDCYGKAEKGYYIDSVVMYGSDGQYRINDAAICLVDGLVGTGDVIIGSNFFDQVQLILNGPQATLGIIGTDQVEVVEIGQLAQEEEGPPVEATAEEEHELPADQVPPTIPPPRVDLPPGGYEGVVYSSDTSENIAGAEISFLSEDGSLERRVYSNADGTYQIELPIARYQVTAWHDDYQTYSTGAGFYIVNRSAVEHGDITMKANPRPEDALVGGFQGVVSDSASGEEIAGALILFEREDGTYRRGVLSDSNGYYWIELPKARFTMTASHGDYQGYSSPPASLEVAGPGTEPENIFMDLRQDSSDGTASCSGLEYGGYCWYFGTLGASCDDVCAAHGDYHKATKSYAGTDGSPVSCRYLFEAMGYQVDDFYEVPRGGMGCHALYNVRRNLIGYWDEQSTKSSFALNNLYRLCACQE